MMCLVLHSNTQKGKDIRREGVGLPYPSNAELVVLGAVPYYGYGNS